MTPHLAADPVRREIPRHFLADFRFLASFYPVVYESPLAMPPLDALLQPSRMPPAVAKVLQAVSTTTVFANPSVVPGPISHTSHNSVPIGPIVGGALGGVLLAVVAVLAWHWWGRSIKHKEAEEKKEALAFFQLRENTRRNASSSLKEGHDSYTASSILRSGNAERKIKFSSSSSESNHSTLKSMNEKETIKNAGDTPTAKYFGFRGINHTPAKPSPLAHNAIPIPPEAPPEETRPTLPRTPSSQSDQLTSLPFSQGGHKGPPLVHKPSKASSLSMYSTQSGEERQHLVPPSLIMAAFRRPDPRRPLVDRLSAAPSAYEGSVFMEQNRLSNISAGSEYLQRADDEPPTDGYAQ